MLFHAIAFLNKKHKKRFSSAQNSNSMSIHLIQNLQRSSYKDAPTEKLLQGCSHRTSPRQLKESALQRSTCREAVLESFVEPETKQSSSQLMYRERRHFASCVTQKQKSSSPPMHPERSHSLFGCYPKTKIITTTKISQKQLNVLHFG